MKWTYEQLGNAMDAIPLPSPFTEQGRQIYRAAYEANLKKAGWTDNEYLDHIEKLLEARQGKESTS